MNMIYNESAPLLATVRGATVADGVLVWSGILVEGRDEALAAAAQNGFSLVSERTENEWWSGVFRAK